MGKTLMIGVAWVATIALAWMLGTSSGGDGEPGRQTANRSTPAADANDRTPERAPAEEPGARAPAKAAAAKPKDDDAPKTDEPPADEEQPFTVEGIESLEDLSARFMKYAAAKLRQGPEGHKELFRTLNELTENKEIRPLMRDERQLVPLAYPWLRFAMDREQQLAAMMETLYKTAAENPGWYAGLDDDPLQLFTEGLAVLVPGVAGPEQMDRLRGYVKTILQKDPKSLPKALQKNLRDFARNLEYWQPQLAPEDALKLVQDPSTPAAQRLALLSRINVSDLRGIELAPILTPSLRVGDGQALRMLSRLPITARDIPALDVAFMEGAATGNIRGWTMSQYLHGTKRNQWAQAQPFFDQGLSRGGKTMEVFAQGLVYSPVKPPKEYLVGVLAAYDFSNQVRAQLKQRYGIE